MPAPPYNEYTPAIEPFTSDRSSTFSARVPVKRPVSSSDKDSFPSVSERGVSSIVWLYWASGLFFRVSGSRTPLLRLARLQTMAPIWLIPTKHTDKNEIALWPWGLNWVANTG